jgi:hypothetical protein
MNAQNRYTYELRGFGLFCQPDITNPEGLDSPYGMATVGAMRGGKQHFTFNVPRELVEGAKPGDAVTFNSITTGRPTAL